MKTNRLICLSFTCILQLVVSRLSAQTISAIFQQNANGQKISTDSCGFDHFASNNNLWTQSAATALDCHNQSYVSDVSNWNIPNYPNGANFNVTIGLSAHLNQSVAVGNLTITNGGALAYDANNSGGGGAHSVTLTLNGGTVTNNGTLTSTGVVEAGQTYQFNVPTLLTGAGTTKLGYGTVLNGPGSLTIDTNQNVIGGGNVQFNNALVNLGVINADGSTGFFEHREVSFANAQITNTGTIKTTAGGVIQFLASTVINNTGGTLSASGDYAFRLNAGVSVTGGTLVSIGDRPRKDFFQVDNATLTGVNIGTGTEMFVDGGTLTLNAAITNGGLITFANTQNPAGTGMFRIASDTTLSGTGHIIVNGAGGTIVPGATLTLGPGQTLDANFTTITGAVTNQGLINAFSDRGLVLNGGNYRNSGTIQSSGGGYLQFGNAGTSQERIFTIDNTNGTIQAIDSSQAEFSGDITVQNGILTTAGTAPIYMQGRLTLQNVTNNGLFHFRRNCGGVVTLQLSGSLTNNGKIDDLVGECNPAEINLLGNVSIGGSGAFVLYRGTTINSANGGVLTNGVGHTIGGNVTINTSLINNGELNVGGDNTLSLNGPTVTNTGMFHFPAGTNVNVGGAVSLTQTAGTIDVDGTMNVPNGLDLNGGQLVGNGTINGPVRNNGGTVGPGHSPGKVTIGGDYTQGANGTLSMEIGGTTAGTSYDQLAVSGKATLGGTLNVTAINGFKPTVGDVYTLVSASSFTGSFTSVNISGFTGKIDTSSNGITLTITSSSRLLLNISTRMRVLQGDKALIGGFIVTGSQPKKVLIRGLGPSIPVAGQLLQDPTLELFDGTNTSIATNDNWKDSQEQEIRDTTVPPTNDLEAAIVRTLAPGNYTAVLRGKNNGTGIGLVEAYDLAQTANSQLANISTRGFVDAGDNVMIGGVIIGGGSAGGTAKVLVRAIGPSLANAGVSGSLQDPTLELRDANGQLLVQNDNWKSDQEQAIRATTIPPSDNREAAIVQTLAAGNYTAIVRGKENTTGVGLVEVYNIQ